MIVFDSICPDINEKVDLVKFQRKGEVSWKTQDILWFGLAGFMAQDALQAI